MKAERFSLFFLTMSLLVVFSQKAIAETEHNGSIGRPFSGGSSGSRLPIGSGADACGIRGAGIDIPTPQLPPPAQPSQPEPPGDLLPAGNDVDQPVLADGENQTGQVQQPPPPQDPPGGTPEKPEPPKGDSQVALVLGVLKRCNSCHSTELTSGSDLASIRFAFKENTRKGFEGSKSGADVESNLLGPDMPEQMRNIASRLTADEKAAIRAWARVSK